MAASEKLKLVDNFSTATNNNNDNISRDELRLIQFTDDYNIHSYPKPIENETLPLNVEFQINLRNVLEVNEVSQICTLETTIRLFWKDSRVSLRQQVLDNHYITLNPSAAHNFWIPDIFIDQVKIGAKIPKKKMRYCFFLYFVGQRT